MAQAAVQTGRLANFNIRAGGFATEVGWHSKGPTGVRFGAGLGMGSGDRDPNDRTINTFDPLYPNLGAFSDAPLWYPSNQIALELNVSRTLGRLVLRGDTVLLARTSLDDAVYANPGRPLTLPNRTERLGAEIFEASARWRVDSRVELYASYVHAIAFDALRREGARNPDFGLMQLTVTL
jgi:hypothetical protein